MCEFLMPLRSLETGAVLFRMLVACLCGAAVGIERSAKNQPAGLRTHILVCIASAVAMTCGLYFYPVVENRHGRRNTCTPAGVQTGIEPRLPETFEIEQWKVVPDSG